jgi:hypothetical protein
MRDMTEEKRRCDTDRGGRLIRFIISNCIREDALDPKLPFNKSGSGIP